MRNEIDSIQRINAVASVNGLTLRGCFRIQESDLIPVLESGRSAAVLMLFGQTGSTVWHSFSRSPEYADGQPHPMDRWSYRIGSALAKELGGSALFPFEGPPWHPFGQWAQRAENIRPSPLGILMHPQHGLWHAYRFAIALPGPVAWFDELESSTLELPSADHACDRCSDQPCLSACPVNAFANGAYNVSTCAEYLRKNEQADCHQRGCLARGACPEGASAAYESVHRLFHMRQFYSALKITSE